MKILFIDMISNVAGHTRTATTIAQALQRRGHDVSFAVTEGSVTKIIDDANLKTYPISAGWAGQYPALAQLIHDLHSQGQVDLVHSFDKRGIAEAVKAAKALRIPIFYTICGGPPRRNKNILKTKPLISLSHEIKDALLEKTDLKDSDIEVIPARLDLGALLRSADEDKRLAHQRFREKYGLPQTSKIVLRIARVASEYKEGLLQGADATAKLYKEGHDVRFVHIGFVPPKYIGDFDDITAHFSALNRAAGATLAVSAQDEALHAHDYLGLADVVIGLGRTAFEGMIFEKPVLLLGTAGFAGLVGRDDAEQLAFYNFSGRHIKEVKPYEQSVAELTDALRELLGSEALRNQVGEFGRAYVLENLDANVAAERYEALYESFSPANYPSDEQLESHLKLTPRRVARALLPDKIHNYYYRLRYSR